MTVPLNVDLVWVRVRTNDPSSPPSTWSYTVVDPVNNDIELRVPVNADGSSPDNPDALFLELYTLFPLSVTQGAQPALQGRGIADASINSSFELIIEFDDGITKNLGPLPAGPTGLTGLTGLTGPQGPPGTTPPIDPIASTGGSRTLGTGAQQAAAGNDSRIVNAVAKGELVINIKDYGAVGNGTTDDATAIQNAINAAKDIGPIVLPNADAYINHSHRGVPVFVPPGNYIINTPIILPRSGQYYRSYNVGLIGMNPATCRITAGASFPTGRALIEWETSASAAENDVRDQIIENLTLVPKDAVGCRAIHFKLLSTRASYGTNVNSVDTMYNCTLKNLIVFGHNTYHQSVITLEGRFDDGTIDGITGDFTLGAATYSTRLLEFEDFTLWTALASNDFFRYQDCPGCNFSRIDNLQVGHRGGRLTGLYGRVGSGSSMRNFNLGIAANGQNASVYLRDSGEFSLREMFGEGGGENGIITLENCQDAILDGLTLGQTDEATAGAPGSAIRVINSKRITFSRKPNSAGVPAYSAQNSKLVRVDSNCRDLKFKGFNGTASFASEWDVDAAALPSIEVDYLDITNSRYTILPRPANSAPLVSGCYIIPVGIRGTAALAASTEYAVPVWLGQSGLLDRIGVEIITAGTAGTLIRLGIRDSTIDSRPGTLLLDAGTVAGDAIASVEATISLEIKKPGIYWLTATAQSTGGTLPTWRTCQNDRPQVYINTLAQAVGSSNTSGYVTSATITGALGSTYTVANRTGIPPLIAVRAA